MSTVGGGSGNSARGTSATVGGGGANSADGDSATVPGGMSNHAAGNYSFVAGRSNQALGAFSTISGGGETLPGTPATANFVYDDYGTIGGGGKNVAGVDDFFADSTNQTYATVAGGKGNNATVEFATVGGGENNTAGLRLTDPPDEGVTPFGPSYATVGGGQNNSARGAWSTVSGGSNNTASEFNVCSEAGCSYSFHTTVGGGKGNTAGGSFSSVGGGQRNTAGGFLSTVGGGEDNQATGVLSTVPGGNLNDAAGAVSFAAGFRAKVAHDGTFLFADLNFFDFNSAASNEFAVRSTGGARFVSAIDGSGNPTAGVQLASGGGSWSSISDRNAKGNFDPVDGRDILERLAAVPIETWNYKSQDESVRHIGPMAQDFYAAFGVGEDDKHITTVDSDGVALAAIKGLYEMVQEKECEVVELRQQNAELAARLAALERAIRSHRGAQ